MYSLIKLNLKKNETKNKSKILKSKKSKRKKHESDDELEETQPEELFVERKVPVQVEVVEVTKTPNENGKNVHFAETDQIIEICNEINELKVVEEKPSEEMTVDETVEGQKLKEEITKPKSSKLKKTGKSESSAEEVIETEASLEGEKESVETKEPVKSKNAKSVKGEKSESSTKKKKSKQPKESLLDKIISGEIAQDTTETENAFDEDVETSKAEEIPTPASRENEIGL
jgi:hypothetical protein